MLSPNGMFEASNGVKGEYFCPDPSVYLGYTLDFLSEKDPRSAKEQFHDAYAHGGGWNKFNGFEFDKERGTIKYPGDPAIHVAVILHFRDEDIYVFPHAWFLILQKDNTCEIARMD